MDTRRLPSRQAKDKAQGLFRELAGKQVSSDEESNEGGRKSKNDSDDYSSQGEKSSESDMETDIKDYYKPVRRVKRPRRKNVKSTATTKPIEVHLTDEDDIVIKEEPESENEFGGENDFGQHNVESKLDVIKIQDFPKTFTVDKQTLKPSDPNTAIWTTSLFTITAVLSDGTESNNELNRDEDQTESAKEGPKTGYIHCPLCQVKFTKMRMKKHLNTVHPGVEKPFICDICNKGWRSWDRMNDHRISHSDTATHQCDFCDKSFKRKYTLQAHVFYKHGSVEGSKRTVQKNSMESAVRNVGPYKIDKNALPPFKCPEPNCEESHDTICRLQRHYSQTHKDRSWICELCGKAFPGQRDLIVHGRCHKEDRPYVCDKCGSTYKSKAHLNCHILRSHDEQGHEAYKAYRRMTVKKLKMTKKMMKEQSRKEDKEQSSNEDTSFLEHMFPDSEEPGTT